MIYCFDVNITVEGAGDVNAAYRAMRDKLQAVGLMFETMDAYDENQRLEQQAIGDAVTAYHEKSDALERILGLAVSTIAAWRDAEQTDTGQANEVMATIERMARKVAG